MGEARAGISPPRTDTRQRARGRMGVRRREPPSATPVGVAGTQRSASAGAGAGAEKPDAAPTARTGRAATVRAASTPRPRGPAPGRLRQRAGAGAHRGLHTRLVGASLASRGRRAARASCDKRSAAGPCSAAGRSALDGSRGLQTTGKGKAQLRSRALRGPVCRMFLRRRNCGVEHRSAVAGR